MLVPAPATDSMGGSLVGSVRSTSGEVSSPIISILCCCSEGVLVDFPCAFSAGFDTLVSASSKVRDKRMSSINRFRRGFKILTEIS